MIVMLFSFTGSAFAVSSNDTIDINFKALSSKYNIGDTVSLKIETTAKQTIQSIEVNVVLPNGSNKSLTTRTSNSKKSTYTTTGTYKPESEGTHTLTVKVTEKDSNGNIHTGEGSQSFTVKNPDKFSIISITPKGATITLGEEIPLLITYQSKTSVKFTLDKTIKEVTTFKDGGVYKKLLLLKPTKTGENEIKILGKNKYNSDLKVVKVNVEE